MQIKVRCFFLVMLMILTHSSICLFQTQNRKNLFLYEPLLFACVLTTIDFKYFCMWPIQNFTDEILCVLPQVWIWSIWHLPCAFETKVTYINSKNDATIDKLVYICPLVLCLWYLWSFRISSEDYGVMGLRYGSSNLSVGATIIPFSGMPLQLISIIILECKQGLLIFSPYTIAIS